MRRSSKPRGTPAGALLAGGLNRAMFAPEKPIEQVTTEDLKIDATRYGDERARAELERRGIDWRAYMRWL